MNFGHGRTLRSPYAINYSRLCSVASAETVPALVAFLREHLPAKWILFQIQTDLPAGMTWGLLGSERQAAFVSAREKAADADLSSRVAPCQLQSRMED